MNEAFHYPYFFVHIKGRYVARCTHREKSVIRISAMRGLETVVITHARERALEFEKMRCGISIARSLAIDGHRIGAILSITATRRCSARPSERVHLRRPVGSRSSPARLHPSRARGEPSKGKYSSGRRSRCR